MQYEFDLTQNYSYKSPLNYPGGKRKTWKYFKEVFPSNIEILVSPFCGGCGLELLCASNNIKVIASDFSEPLINFWQYYQKDSNALINRALKLFPLSYEETRSFYLNQLEHNCKSIEGNVLTDFERAVIYFLINKQSFRGIGLAQSPQKTNPQGVANKQLIESNKGWYNPNITFLHNDYKNILDQYNGNFMYFDPPYVGAEHFYGSNISGRNTFDHKEFRNKITSLNNQWILSYRKHDLIVDLYKDFRIVEYNFAHHYRGKGTKLSYGAKQVIELFIMNF